MASIIYGNGVADIRGSINGTTFSRNANGAYARNKTTPTNPRTAAQVAQRARLISLVTGWRALTDVQRKAWIDGTGNYPYTNRLGIASLYTGQQLYTKLNLGRLAATQAELTSPPVPANIELKAFASVDAILMGGALSVFSIAFASATSGITMQVYASVNVSAGISASSYPKKLIDTIASPTDTLDVATAYTAVFGTPALGSRIMFEVKAVVVATGQIVTAAVGSVVVA